MKFQESAGMVVFRKTEQAREYLLLHYPHGHWDLPKGKIEKGESEQEAALRELEEETGLHATILDGFQEAVSYIFSCEGERIKKTVYFFVAQAEAGPVTLSHEHIGYEWLSYADALKRLTFENARFLFTKAHDFLEHKKTG